MDAPTASITELLHEVLTEVRAGREDIAALRAKVSDLEDKAPQVMEAVQAQLANTAGGRLLLRMFGTPEGG